MIWPFRSRGDADLIMELREEVKMLSGENSNLRVIIRAKDDAIARAVTEADDWRRQMWAVFRNSGLSGVAVPMEDLRRDRPVMPPGMRRDYDARRNVMNYTNLEVKARDGKENGPREEYRGEAKAAPAERREAGGRAAIPVIPFTGRLVPRQLPQDAGCGDRGRDDDANS